jgi:hypothetical protein
VRRTLTVVARQCSELKEALKGARAVSEEKDSGEIRMIALAEQLNVESCNTSFLALPLLVFPPGP